MYKKIGFAITLTKKVSFSIPIPFLFRSVIGFQLRKMCCIAHNSVCAECMFNATCIYCVTFESIVPKDNAALAGRDRISHPIIIDTDTFAEETLDSFIVNLIFMGSTIPYFPYFYHALVKAGESGIAKERVTYQVNDIIEYANNGETRSLMIDDAAIETHIEPIRWECDTDADTSIEKKFLITLLSPLRYKTQGLYASKLVDSEFARCLHRRVQVLCSQYGGNDHGGGYEFTGEWAVTEYDVKWRNFVHYSARQKEAMRLGGLLGSFVLAGKFSPYEYGFLQFAQAFHAGKNTNFGMGKLKVKEYDSL